MKRNKILKIGFVLVVINFCIPMFAFCAEKWTGVDESVVGKYAKEHGREKRKSFIDTDQGDLLLFVFLLAGVLGGFTAGYYWKVLISEKPMDRGMNREGHP